MLSENALLPAWLTLRPFKYWSGFLDASGQRQRHSMPAMKHGAGPVLRGPGEMRCGFVVARLSERRDTLGEMGEIRRGIEWAQPKRSSGVGSCGGRGEHQPIIDEKLFEAVRTKLTENLRGRRLRRQSSNALLMGKLFDDRGNPMTPSYAIKKGVRYRYYVSCVLAQGRKEDAGSVARVAAQAVERLILDAINALPPAKQIETQPGSPSAELLSPGRDADAATTPRYLPPLSTKSPLVLGRSKSGSSKDLTAPSR